MPASGRVDLFVQEAHTFNNSFKQEVFASFGTCPINAAELWISADFRIRPVVTELEKRTVYLVQSPLYSPKRRPGSLTGRVFPKSLRCSRNARIVSTSSASKASSKSRR